MLQILLLLKQFSTALVVNADACKAILSSTNNTHNGLRLSNIYFFFVYLFDSIQQTVDKDAVFLVFGELFIKKLSLAVRAFDHTFISIYLIWSAVERLYLAITPLNLYFYQLFIFLRELWRFSSITLLLVLSKLVVIELFDTFRVVDFKTKSPEALTADATLIE